MKAAKEQAPSHIAKKFDLKKQKEKVIKIRTKAENKLEKIQKGVKITDRELKQKYSETKNNSLKEEINFLEDIAHSTELFLEKGDLEPPLEEDVRNFVKSKIENIKQQENERKNKTRRMRDSERSSGSFL